MGVFITLFSLINIDIIKIHVNVFFNVLSMVGLRGLQKERRRINTR